MKRLLKIPAQRIQLCVEGSRQFYDVPAAIPGKNHRSSAGVGNPMSPHTALYEAEIKAIYAYLQTVPVVSNKVERYSDQWSVIS